jgi:23S rRNA (cytosine1962-C5)-methyltransferase
MSQLPVMVLKPGREKNLLRYHRWIFSGAVAEVDKSLPAGSDVLVVDHKGRKLAVAAYSPSSQIMGRVWSFDPSEKIDGGFFRRRIKESCRIREAMGLAAADGGCRLIFSEGDSLPGLTVDRYCEYLVMQITSAGAEFHRDEIVESLLESSGAKGVIERLDLSVRRHENLPEREAIEAGARVPDKIIVSEDTDLFEADVRNGQKTGFYFDLREARRAVRSFARGRRVLNGFCYTGGFAVGALKNGAESVLNIDSSNFALETAKRNILLNGIDPSQSEFCRADVFTALRQLKEEGRKFDMVIVDPPKLVDCRSSLMRGCRAYQDLARLGFSLLEKDGILMNFSCSGLMPAELFQKITADAAQSLGLDGARIIGRIHQAGDHPVALGVPESAYLKGLISTI